MRHLSRGLILLMAASCILSACKKHNDPVTLALLKHRWQVISLNGEAFRYVGKPADYFDFGNDTLMEFISGKYDTFIYRLSNNDHTLTLFPILTGIATEQLKLDIRSLTGAQLILSGGVSTPPINILDSLSR